MSPTRPNLADRRKVEASISEELSGYSHLFESFQQDRSSLQEVLWILMLPRRRSGAARLVLRLSQRFACIALRRNPKETTIKYSFAIVFSLDYSFVQITTLNTDMTPCNKYSLEDESEDTNWSLSRWFEFFHQTEKEIENSLVYRACVRARSELSVGNIRRY